jgi:hypothetical protein
MSTNTLTAYERLAIQMEAIVPLVRTSRLLKNPARHGRKSGGG